MKSPLFNISTENVDPNATPAELAATVECELIFNWYGRSEAIDFIEQSTKCSHEDAKSAINNLYF